MDGKRVFAAILLIQVFIASMQCGVSGKKPNIVIFMADDLGYGDVGCFGNTTLNTPNIDSLAKDGVKMTQHLTTSSLCTPSRAAFMTGRYQTRSGMAPTLSSFRISLFAASPAGLPPEEVTIAELAKSAGYRTALIGKWHLGIHSSFFRKDFLKHPTSQGYDSFYGFPITNMKDFGDEGDSVLRSNSSWTNVVYICTALIVALSLTWLKRKVQFGKRVYLILMVISLYPSVNMLIAVNNFKALSSMLFRDRTVVEQPMRLRGLTHRFVQEGVEFLQSRREDQEPFLLHFAWSHPHTFLDPAKPFRGRTRHGRYGDCVEELDWGIGEILRTLDEFNMAEDTLVYFTSDNGPHLEERGIHGEIDGGYGGIYKGGKAHGTVDGGFRVPGIIRWPGHVTAGLTVDAATSLMDIYQLVSTATGTPVPSDREIDGKDILPLLQAKTQESPHEFLFHYCRTEIHAARYMPREGDRVWKLAYKLPNYFPNTTMCHFACECTDAIVLDPPVLYDMTSDPGETTPIRIDSSPEFRKIADTINAAVQKHLDSVKPVQPQFTTIRQVWQPQLQPCCSFPSCVCTDPKFKDFQNP